MPPRASFFPSVPATCLAFLLPAQAALSGVAATGTLGVQALSGFGAVDFGYNLSAYYKFDDQVLLGVQTGQGTAEDASAVPILASGFVRLPVGRVAVPVATGGMGYAFSRSAGGVLWRAGGCLDIRNGRRSSLLFGAEYEGGGNRSGIVLRGGLLLEM